MKEPRGGKVGGAGMSGAGCATGAAPGKRTLTDTLQRRASGAAPAGDAAASPGGPREGPSATGAGAPLPDALQARMEGAFDFDFSAVRVHEGDQAAAMGAVAYTQGADLHFAPGQYDPGSRGGQELIGHELAHVVQQSEGRVPTTTQFKGVDGNDDAGLEAEADTWGSLAAAGEPVGRSGGGSRPGAQAALQRKQGDLEHQATHGAGTVTTRKNDLDPNDNSQTNYSLEYAGKDADKAHWLQFVDRTMYADQPGTGRVHQTGQVRTSSGMNRKWSTPDTGPQWSIDSASRSDPYYEAVGSNVREPGKSTKIFDEPGGKSIEPFAEQFAATKAPKAATVTLVLTFDTYLVKDGKSVHHVSWTATTVYDVKAKASGAIAYATGTAGAVAGLPKDLKKVLDTEYAGNKIT